MIEFQKYLGEVENVDGSFAEVGFGKGKTFDSIVSFMKSNTFKKRKGYLFDLFNTVPIQPALDRRFLLPGYDIKVLKGDINLTLSESIQETLAFAHIDLGTYDATIATLDKLFPLLDENGLIFISSYNEQVQEAISNFFNSNNLNHKKFLIDGGYIVRNNIVAPVLFNSTVPSKIKINTPEVREPSRKKDKLPEFTDRYIKPIIEKFKPKKVIKPGLTPIGKKVTK